MAAFVLQTHLLATIQTLRSWSSSGLCLAIPCFLKVGFICPTNCLFFDQFLCDSMSLRAFFDDSDRQCRSRSPHRSPSLDRLSLSRRASLPSCCCQPRRNCSSSSASSSCPSSGTSDLWRCSAYYCTNHESAAPDACEASCQQVRRCRCCCQRAVGHRLGHCYHSSRP